VTRPILRDVRPLVVDTGHGRNFLFVVLETENGILGVGEGSQSDQDLAVAANVRQLRDRLVGRSIFELIESLSLVTRSPRSGRAMVVAVSAIEQALWDCIGKHVGVPVYQLLGGAVRERVPCYATLSAGLESFEPAELAAEAARCVDEGLAAVKVPAFRELKGAATVGVPLLSKRSLELGKERLLAVREAIGPEIGLMLECDFALDRVALRELVPFLERLGCSWIEAPLAWDDARALADLRRHTPFRIASGEIGHGRLDAVRLIERRSVDVLQPDVKWAGGILEVRKIAAWAEAHQVAIALHNNSGPVATAASAHLSLVIPNALALEIPSRRPGWESTLTADDPIVAEGHVDRDRLAERPGLGIAFDETLLADVQL
jgi:galactonate dehydratase